MEENGASVAERAAREVLLWSGGRRDKSEQSERATNKEARNETSGRRKPICRTLLLPLARHTHTRTHTHTCTHIHTRTHPRYIAQREGREEREREREKEEVGGMSDTYIESQPAIERLKARPPDAPLHASGRAAQHL